MTPPAPPQGAKKMTPEQMRVAIAEACGWACIENGNSMALGGMFLKGYPPKLPIIGAKDLLPDYLADLNACHEMEALVKKDVRLYLRYGQELIKLSGDGMFDAMFSTAPQRCEAFLKCLNLWPAP